MKKTIIIILSAIGGLIAIAITAFIVLVVNMAKVSDDYKQQDKEDKDTKVINYVMEQYEDSGDIESIVVTNSYAMGSGSPVPFSGDKDDKRFVYQLLINDEYKVSVLADWSDGSMKIMDSNYNK